MEQPPRLRVINERTSPGRGIDRREMVRRLLGGTSAGIIFPALSPGHPVHKHLASDATLREADAKVAASVWEPEFLDPHENETLIVLAERIVPGSTKAQVNRFIDLLLSVDTRENRQKFTNSLSAIDGVSMTQFGRAFKALTEGQQTEVLTAASTASDLPAEGEASNPAPAQRSALRHHFDNLKAWISGAYYSSEIGMRELGWTGDTFFESFPGCPHPEGHH